MRPKQILNLEHFPLHELQPLLHTNKNPDGGLYLAGVHRCGGECCLAQGDGRSQQVSGCSLVLTGLQFQLLPGQHRLIAWSVTWGREELKLAMTTPEEETHPAV